MLLIESSGSQVLMDAVVKPQAINQLQLILNAAHSVLHSWPKVKQEKSATSCCLGVGISNVNHRNVQPLTLSPRGPSTISPQCCV